jgi:hypothetical protein
MSNPTQSRPLADPKRELLPHTLATLAYRGGKAVRNAPVKCENYYAADIEPGRVVADQALPKREF